MGGPKSLKLMDFQLEGVSWLYFKWWIKQGGILSDEMGLGKYVGGSQTSHVVPG